MSFLRFFAFVKSPLKIEKISIIDPYSLQRFYREAEDEMRFPTLPTEILSYKSKFKEFYVSIFEKYKEEKLLEPENLKKEEEEKHSEKKPEVLKKINQKEFRFFIDFLKFNGNLSYAKFLKNFLNDKAKIDEVSFENFDKYSMFFEINSVFFLHSDAETRSKFFKIKSAKMKRKIC